MTERYVTVITGAGGALGSAVSAHLIAAGHDIAALVLPADEDRVRGALDPAHSRVLGADVTSGDAWRGALERIETELGAPTGAVLIAGAWRSGIDDAAWRMMLTVNLETARQSLASLLPKMKERRAGSIVLIGSRAAVRPWESADAAAYATSKAAVVALASAMSEEVRDSGVRVNVVLPSTIDTPQNRRSMPEADFARWVAPDSIASVIAFLLSDAARDVSGAAIPVYGRS